MESTDSVFAALATASGMSNVIPSREAIEQFQAMLADTRSTQESRLAAAQAKRDRRAARNLVNSHRVVGRCRGNVA